MACFFSIFIVAISVGINMLGIHKNNNNKRTSSTTQLNANEYQVFRNLRGLFRSTDWLV